MESGAACLNYCLPMQVWLIGHQRHLSLLSGCPVVDVNWLGNDLHDANSVSDSALRQVAVLHFEAAEMSRDV